MRRKRSGNLVELPLLIALVGISLAVFVVAVGQLNKAEVGLLAIPLALLVLVAFWAVWVGGCYVIKTGLNLVRPASQVDLGLVFILTTVIAMLGLSILVLVSLAWLLIIRPIMGLFG